MPSSLKDMMWAEALVVLARGNPQHQTTFRPTSGGWEPPVDVLETEAHLIVIVALPGIPRADIEVVLSGDDLLVRGTRRWVTLSQTARVRRIELPHGRFERRLPLPHGAYQLVGDNHVDGCLILTLQRLG